MDKKAVAIVAVVVAGGLAALLLLKKPASGGSEGLQIILYDDNGNPITASGMPYGISASPSMVTEGDTINAKLTVLNTSYQVLGGVDTPVAASLTLKFSATAPNATLVATGTKTYGFGAGAALTIDYTSWSTLRFTIPVGSGSPGSVSCQLLDPAGDVINSAVVSFTINPAPVTYGGSIVFV